MQHTLSVIAAILCILLSSSLYADSLDIQITKNVKELCESPNDPGSHYQVTVGGEANADIRIRLLGLIGLNGDAEFTKEEWEGVRSVLKEDQAGENKNYRACVVELTPLFLEKLSPQPVSERDRVARFLDFLCDRAVLYNPWEWEDRRAVYLSLMKYVIELEMTWTSLLQILLLVSP